MTHLHKAGRTFVIGLICLVSGALLGAIIGCVTVKVIPAYDYHKYEYPSLVDDVTDFIPDHCNVRVLSPDGTAGTIPSEQVSLALKAGYKLVPMIAVINKLTSEQQSIPKEDWNYVKKEHSDFILMSDWIARGKRSEPEKTDYSPVGEGATIGSVGALLPFAIAIWFLLLSCLGQVSRTIKGEDR